MAEQGEPGNRPIFDYERRDDGTHAFYFCTPRLPGEFGEHVRNAQREALLALRSLLDAAIERQAKESRRSSGPRNIDVG